MEQIEVVIRTLPNGDEYDIELALDSTGSEILSALMDGDVIPRTDEQGNAYQYQIIDKKGGNVEIGPNETIGDKGVQNSSTLVIMPKLVAG